MPIYFQLSSHPLPITLESIGNHWEQVAIQRQHGYHCYHWLQTESGVGEVLINNRQVILKPGAGILIPSFVPHAYYSLDSWVTKFATFEGAIKESFYQILQSNTYITATDTAEFSFSEWIDQLISCHIIQQLQPIELTKQCYSFLLHLRQRNESHMTNQHPLFKQYIVPVIKEIETHYHEISSIEKLAQSIYISPQYLNRLFNRFVGNSPYQYLMTWRLNKAKELLINFPQLEVQHIGLKVGFQSPSQFTAMFKQNIGYTPNQFRQLYRANQNKNDNK